MEIDNLVTNPEALATDNPQTEEEETPTSQPTGEVTETPTKESPQKDYEAAKERFKQQEEGSKKEIERYKEIALQTAIKNATYDSSTLLELHKQDPRLAAEAAKTFEWSNTERGDYQSFLKQDAKISTQISEDEIEARATKKAEEIIAQKEHDKALAKASKKIEKLDDDVKEEAQARFNKLIDGKMLNEEDALEYAEMATLYVSKSKRKDDVYNDAITKLASTGVTSSKK